ncbi:AMP-binding enzyme [Micromonospora echinofusca]|uniref:AMP-binding enzyme n=1 Tax=Micromonospora echinofusca TaxID=47858 RepID=UPI001FCAEEC1|nr:phosphopantetheine-binding protein [Micromonospora echinofusca]
MGEIDSALVSHPGVRAGAAVALGDRHHRRLVGYYVPDQTTLDETELDRHLRDRLPTYMVPPTLVALSELPLTANGKVDRSALPDPAADTGPAGPVAELDDPTGLVAQVAAIVAEVIGLAEVDLARNYLEIGGDSITAVQIVTRANDARIALTLQDLFEQPTIGKAAAAALARSGDRVDADARLLPVTSGQRAALDAPARRIEVTVGPEVTAEVAGRTVTALVRRHPALRLLLVNGQQTVRPPAEEAEYVPTIDLSALPEARRATAFESMVAEMGDELSPHEGPVVKAALFDLAGARTLVWVLHPAVVDETSRALLADEFGRALAGDLPPAEPVPLPAWLSAVAEDDGPPPNLSVPEIGVADATTVTASLTEEESTELADTAHAAYRMSLAEVGLAVIVAVADPGVVLLERDARRDVPSLDLTGAVGPFTRTRLVALDPPDDPAALLVAAKEAARSTAAVPGNPQLSLRWLGSVPELPSARTRTYPDEVTAAVVGGRLTVVWTGAAPDAEAVVAGLRDLLAHCRGAEASVSAGDFPLSGLDGDELRRVLAGLTDAS